MVTINYLREVQEELNLFPLLETLAEVSVCAASPSAVGVDDTGAVVSMIQCLGQRPAIEL